MTPTLPIPKFSGEVKGDLENFTDWKERFQMIAEAHHWDERIKLVNLVTKLCGQVYSFYRSCDGWQRSCYVELVETTFHIIQNWSCTEQSVPR